MEIMQHVHRSKWVVHVLAVAVLLGLAFSTYTDLSFLRRMQYTRHPSNHNPIDYSYIGNDYPQTWPLPPLDRVQLSLENTVHYGFGNDELTIKAWNTTLPTGGAVVRLGPAGRQFTVGMFHRLGCVAILQEILADFYANESPLAQIDRPELAHHCMNYLRQMTLCTADLRLESLRASHGNQLTVPYVTHTCNDWEAVYHAAEMNYEEHLAREGKSGWY